MDRHSWPRPSLIVGARRRATGGVVSLAVAAFVAISSGAPAMQTRLLTQPLAAGAIEVRGFGDASSFGAPGMVAPGQQGVALASSRSGAGYWIADSYGGVFAYGDAPFLGSAGNTRLNQSIVAMAATPSGGGYWLVAADGGIFAYGDAGFHGSTGALALNLPIVGITRTPTGNGYWLVARDGGIFAFGDAPFLGSTGGLALSQPIVGMASTPSGNGYWLAARDGGVFAYGDAAFHGAAVGATDRVAAIAATPDGNGYWLAGVDGGVFAYGSARFAGSAAGVPNPVTAIAATPSGAGYWILTSPAGTIPAARGLLAPPVPAVSGSGRRVVYGVSAQRVWLVEADGVVYDSYLVSGHRGYPPPGTYAVWTRMRHGRAGSLDLPYFVGFAHGRTTSVGFHGIPLRPNGSPIQSDSELGQYRSHGCVRQNQADAVEMWSWAPLDTTVVVLA